MATAVEDPRTVRTFSELVDAVAEKRSQYRFARTTRGEETILRLSWDPVDFVDLFKQRLSYSRWLKIVADLGPKESFSAQSVNYALSQHLESSPTSPSMIWSKSLPNYIQPLSISPERLSTETNEVDRDREDNQVVPSDEKYLDARLASIEKTVQMGLDHQSKQIETIISHLGERVVQATDQSRESRKELRQSQWAALSIFVALIVLLVGSLITILYNSNTVERSLTTEFGAVKKEVSGLRKDIDEKTERLTRALQQAVATTQKLQSTP